MKENRVNVEVGRSAYLKLAAEVRRRNQLEGRGKKYPSWRIVDELLNTLPEPDGEEEPEPDEEVAGCPR